MYLSASAYLPLPSPLAKTPPLSLSLSPAPPLLLGPWRALDTRQGLGGRGGGRGVKDTNVRTISGMSSAAPRVNERRFVRWPKNEGGTCARYVRTQKTTGLTFTDIY